MAPTTPSAVSALDEMPMPETPKRCHTFLGAVGFFRGFKTPSYEKHNETIKPEEINATGNIQTVHDKRV
jgi:hypothetical protein